MNDTINPLAFFEDFYEYKGFTKYHNEFPNRAEFKGAIKGSKPEYDSVKEQVTYWKTDEDSAIFRIYKTTKLFKDQLEEDLTYQVNQTLKRIDLKLLSIESEEIRASFFKATFKKVQYLEECLNSYEEAHLYEENAFYLKRLTKYILDKAKHFNVSLDQNRRVKNTEGNSSVTESRRIIFNKAETIKLLLNELRTYFENQEDDLSLLLNGNTLENPMVFPHNQNKLVEVFKRLKYNNLILNTPTEIRDWLCENFQFTKKIEKGKAVTPLNSSTVWDILAKGKGEPTRKERICVVDWLPYSSHDSLKE